MVVATPKFQHVTQDQYGELLAALDGVAEKDPGLAQELRDKVERVIPQEVVGQQELPLEWDDDAEG